MEAKVIISYMKGKTEIFLTPLIVSKTIEKYFCMVVTYYESVIYC